MTMTTTMVADDDADFEKSGNHRTMGNESQTQYKTRLSLTFLTTATLMMLQWPSIVKSSVASLMLNTILILHPL